MAKTKIASRRGSSGRPVSNSSGCLTKEASLNSLRKIRVIYTDSGRIETLDLSTWSGECTRKSIELMYLTYALVETRSKIYAAHGKKELVVFLPSASLSSSEGNSNPKSIDLPVNCLSRTQTLSLLVE